ncbi:hypothetical protein GVAV_000182 [Gurleya vavrai]
MEINKQLFDFDIFSIENINKIKIYDYEAIQKRAEVKKKFSSVFSLKDDLTSVNSYEEFVKLNLNAHKELKKVIDSKYLKSVWEETDCLRKDFLDKMCIEIEKQDQSIDEVLKYFNFYYKIEKLNEDSKLFKEMQKLEKTENIKNYKFTKSYIMKLENTLLVNTKLNLDKFFSENDILQSIDEAKTIIYKIIDYKFDFETKEEILKSFMEHVYKNIIDLKEDDIFYQILVKEIDDFIYFISRIVNSSVKYKILNEFHRIKDKISENLLYP